jgi:hypothetical protein
MGIWAWCVLLAWSAGIATAAQYVFFRHDRGRNDFDWVYMAGGGLIGGFTAHVWYPVAGLPVVDGLNVVQALAGGVAGAAAIELVYRFFIRGRQATV